MRDDRAAAGSDSALKADLSGAGLLDAGE